MTSYPAKPKPRHRVRCRCGDTIESKELREMVWCKCKAIGLDGGLIE